MSLKNQKKKNKLLNKGLILNKHLLKKLQIILKKQMLTLEEIKEKVCHLNKEIVLIEKIGQLVMKEKSKGFRI